MFMAQGVGAPLSLRWQGWVGDPMDSRTSMYLLGIATRQPHPEFFRGLFLGGSATEVGNAWLHAGATLKRRFRPWSAGTSSHVPPDA